LILLLNKCDLVDPAAVGLKDVRTLAGEREIPVLATSARTGLNVEPAFSQLGRMVVEEWMRKKHGQ
jgi:Fe2+ transport system protein B